VLRVEGLNVYDVMRHEQFVVTVEALQRIEEALLS
jgi:ribosomal protein L4